MLEVMLDLFWHQGALEKTGFRLLPNDDFRWKLQFMDRHSFIRPFFSIRLLNAMSLVQQQGLSGRHEVQFNQARISARQLLH